MSASFKAGDTAYILENNRIIRECRVIRQNGNLFVIRFVNGGGIQVSRHRLFTTQEEAEASVPKLKEKKKQKTGYGSPYDYWH